MAGLATACGVAKNSVSQWLDRIKDKPPTEMLAGSHLVAAARYLETTAEWLMTGRGVNDVTSQAARPDPAILAQTQEFLETAYAFKGKPFDLRADADLFADAYEWLAEDERPVDQRNLVHFGRWLAGRQQANEAADEDENESGNVAGQTAGKDRGRAARSA